MTRTPVSIHLERHRECLERHRRERGGSIEVDDNRLSVPARPSLDRPGGRFEAMPFERRDDE